MTPGKINEEIVLDSYNGFKSYSMIINTDGLTPVANEFGRVELIDKSGNVMMTIAAPYMYDAVEVVSEDIEVTVTQENKKEWRITYTPDAEWLSDKERVYPIVIDPVVTTKYYAQVDQLDTYVRAGQTYAYNDSGPTLYVGYYGGENWTYWGVETLPGLNEVTNITGASFNIKLQGGTTSMGNIGLYDVDTALNTATMMWSNKPALRSKRGEISTVPGDLWLRYSTNELGDLLKNFYRAQWSNFGFALKYETYINDWNQFYSSDYTVNNNASIPYLEVRYTTTFQTPADGTYYIQNVYTGKYLASSGSSVYLSDYGAGGTAVQWTLQRNLNHPDSYNIVPSGNTSLGLYFNMDYGTITLPAKSGNGWGRWWFEMMDNGSYLILSAGRPWMSLTGSGTSVYPHATHTGTSQQWIISSTPPPTYSQNITSGMYYIRNLYENKYLTHDTKAEVETYEASSKQRWSVVYSVSDNTYLFYPTDDTTYGMGIYNNTIVDEQVLRFSVNETMSSVKMRLINNGDGTYSIVPASNGIYRLGVYTDMSETKTIGGVTQTMWQNKTVCLGLSSTSNTQKWVFEPTTDKKAVILIHGRDSNSAGCYGALNDIGGGENDAFNVTSTSDGDSYILYDDQCIYYISGIHDEGGNLADYLEQNGYIRNVNLFVFNYPNQDAVIHNAQKFKTYVENLVAYAINQGSSEMKHALGINGNNYSFNIVGHSMGGLVARYYIENLGYDEHVDKLITIDTPHWGSGFADISNYTSIHHMLCDHDLSPNSAMFGGSNPLQLENGCDLLEITDQWTKCTDDTYNLTNELSYSVSRQTDYYAIAGIDYDAYPLSDNSITINLPTNFTTYDQLSDYLQEQTNNNLYRLSYAEDNDDPNKYYMSVKDVDDNIVSFLSQIGWTNNDGNSPSKKINFEKIFVLIDTNGGNTLLSMLHSKMQHRQPVMNKVLSFLAE